MGENRGSRASRQKPRSKERLKVMAAPREVVRLFPQVYFRSVSWVINKRITRSTAWSGKCGKA